MVGVGESVGVGVMVGGTGVLGTVGVRVGVAVRVGQGEGVSKARGRLSSGSGAQSRAMSEGASGAVATPCTPRAYPTISSAQTRAAINHSTRRTISSDST